jgi:hypothetical protein
MVQVSDPSKRLQASQLSYNFRIPMDITYSYFVHQNHLRLFVAVGYLIRFIPKAASLRVKPIAVVANPVFDIIFSL